MAKYIDVDKIDWQEGVFVTPITKEPLSIIHKIATIEMLRDWQQEEDVRPVVRGKWITTNDYVTTAYGTLDYYRCSCCGEDSLEEGDFCPNCGADMREVEE
jgi:hypothetical protein